MYNENFYTLSNSKNSMYLHPPPSGSTFSEFYLKKNNQNEIKIDSSFKYSGIKSDTKYIENKDAYNNIWKSMHYVSSFIHALPGEEKETEIAFAIFIKCISELIPNDEYSRHMKEFMIKYPIYNCKTPNEKFKWTYKLHSYINLIRFVKNLKYLLLSFSKKNIEIILGNYCKSLEMDKIQTKNCIQYVNTKINSISNENTDFQNDYINIENISFNEALHKYTISDTNIVTKNDWGPSIWTMIHFFAANLKKDKISFFNEFIKSLMYLIPCEECRKHMRENIKKIPLVISTKSDNKTIFEWSCNFHNLVNSKLNKPVIQNCNSIFKKYLDKYQSTYEFI